MKTVVITGGTQGIGLATLIKFAANGYQVISLARKPISPDNLEEIQSQLSAAATKHIHWISCDLGQTNSMDLAISQIQAFSQHGIDCLVNNAGAFKTGQFKDQSSNDYRLMFEVNFFGPLYLTQKLLGPLMKKKGNVVNISSTLALKPTKGTGAYSASKAALNHWTQLLALELAPHGVRVNGINPGLVETPIHGFDQLSPSQKEEKRSSMASLQALGRIGNPTEIAEAVYFLGSTASDWTTGASLTVDGGISL